MFVSLRLVQPQDNVVRFSVVSFVLLSLHNETPLHVIVLSTRLVDVVDAGVVVVVAAATVDVEDDGGGACRYSCRCCRSCRNTPTTREKRAQSRSNQQHMGNSAAGRVFFGGCCFKKHRNLCHIVESG